MVNKWLIKNILVAIDGSKSSDKALDFALDLAQKYTSKIVLISVFEPLYVSMITLGIGLSPVNLATHIDGLMDFRKKILLDAVKKAKNTNSELAVTQILAEGRPTDKIVETAKEQQCDLIVIGSRGLGGIKEFFLGSVSDRVADHAQCPVLIIK